MLLAGDEGRRIRVPTEGNVSRAQIAIAMWVVAPAIGAMVHSTCPASVDQASVLLMCVAAQAMESRRQRHGELAKRAAELGGRCASRPGVGGFADPGAAEAKQAPPTRLVVLEGGAGRAFWLRCVEPAHHR